MPLYANQISDATRRRALTGGSAGRAWLAELDVLVADLAGEWDLTLGKSLSGGSEALVVACRTSEGRDAVLKVFIPGVETSRSERDILALAAGRGYAELLASDSARDALLLERLGAPLESLGWPVEQQIDALCDTLEQAWRVPEGPFALMNGADKAQGLIDFIQATRTKLGGGCSDRVADVALALAAERRQSFHPANAVIAHGDCHAGNTLCVPGSDPPRFKFVDPDGLFIERAYDLGILMREGTEDYLAGDPLRDGRKRCAALAERVGEPPDAIWQWGLIERVSTGLMLKLLGLDGEGEGFLAVAEAWAA